MPSNVNYSILNIIVSHIWVRDRRQDYDHDLWLSAYVPKEDDGCLVEPRGTLNPKGVDLDFADGDQVCWWHMKDGAILGVHNGMILEYDAWR